MIELDEMLMLFAIVDFIPFTVNVLLSKLLKKI
jgi:hypothetical protein